MGPLHLQQLPSMASLWPIICFRGSANALRWAYCISGYCCRWHHLGPIIFPQVLPMPWNGPIALVAAAANGCAWAHYFFGRRCRCIWMGPLLFFSQDLALAQFYNILSPNF